ncbi:fungal-specific transcription factor domain-containing protein [Apodospora peruviana]|uniref:Fungal-specific transcription factor domain-containing protein n=1 Tax=Apodospora peruviana TaxID=516989 RepID=A0AAE0M149_9PEZI|nr:fungal-specific transcription factor domain-containing protein [Apodospora peruviana]
MPTLMNGTIPPPKQIRFVNNQGQPPSKRRRINAACLTCRKRKTRCAGEKPVCSTCTKNGHTCLGYTDIVENQRERNVKREDGDESAAPRSDRRDAIDLGNEQEDEFMVVEEEEEDERRHWKSKTGPKVGSFANQDGPLRRDSRESNPSLSDASGRPRRQSNDWDHDSKSQSSSKTVRRSAFVQTASYSEDGRSSNNRSPVQHHTESHRMPYFRYFGPTAIVPGYKRMVVSVHRDRRKSRGGSFSATSPASLFGHGIAHNHLPHTETVFESLEDMPVYDVNDSAPVHPLIITLIKTFFLHLGCNYPFLREQRFLRMPILVDSMCALAARFSDLPIFTSENDGIATRSEYGHVFAQRAKAATVDTFPCPSVAAVQACLLMAYEGFGANQDSALWMYLGLAIRMAVDLGLQKMVGIKYQGERDPWYTRSWSRKSSDAADESDNKQNDDDQISREEQEEVEQERTDTFWAVFVLDRVISSGTGRPVTFRDDDFELALPQPTLDPVSGWPAPFPAFTQIIHLYGRVSDVLNNIRNANDLTEEKMARLSQMESDLTKIYQKQDQRLHFSAPNFKHYVKTGQGTTFILLHFWFHALIIVLHQPTLLTPFGSRPTRLLPNSRELSMSSAKTIADILAFAELIDPKSFIGNPFTSQPMYIAACAFLMESVANASTAPSRESSPAPDSKSELQRTPSAKPISTNDTRSAKHSLLASAATQNYQRCYKSLQQLQQYWGGVGYILTALDQKSKGIWDCETFTNEEFESAKFQRRASFSRLPRFDHPASPNVPPIAWSLTGTTNSPNSSLTLLYQNNPPGSSAAPSLPPVPSSVPVSAATPPGNMIYDPIRQSLPETPSMFPPAYPQPNVSAVRYQAHPSKTSRPQGSSTSGVPGKSHLKYETVAPDDMDANSPMSDSKVHVFSGIPQHASYTPSSHSSGYETSVGHGGSPSSSFTESGTGHPSHYQQHGHNYSNGVHNGSGHGRQGSYQADFAQSGLVSGSYSYLGLNTIQDITFDSQEINFDTLGLPNEMMPPWLEILPGDVLNLFEGGMAGVNQGHMS